MRKKRIKARCVGCEYSEKKENIDDIMHCYFCKEDHERARQREANKKRKEKCIKLHLCIKCGKKFPEEDKHKMCPECREKAREIQNLKNAIKREKRKGVENVQETNTNNNTAGNYASFWDYLASK